MSEKQFKHYHYHSAQKQPIPEHEAIRADFREYRKFAYVMLGIFALTLLLTSWQNWELQELLSNFMGVFLLTFGGFKIFNLKEFANGFASYDIVAKRYIIYGYAYPIIQLILGAGFTLLGNVRLLNWATLIISLVSSVGVYQALSKKSKVHCVCLGTVIKLPLSTVSFVEDFGMGIMAFAMLIIG